MILFSSGFVFWFWSLTSTWLQLKMTISPFTNRLSCSFRATEPDDLVALQSKEWDPIVEWFNERWACFYDPMCMHLYYTTRGCGLTHPGIHHPRPHWLSNELLICINKRGKKTKKKKKTVIMAMNLIILGTSLSSSMLSRHLGSIGGCLASGR